MKLGFGFYHHMLSRGHYDFARQCGATHAVVHLVDYFHKAPDSTGEDQPLGNLETGWGLAGGTPVSAWSVDSLRKIRSELADAGLELYAIENFDPAHWHDVLLDGPKKLEQIGFLKQIIRNAGEVGIPVIGYNFSIAGVAGRVPVRAARGGAGGVGMQGIAEGNSAPIPNGMVWNMRYDLHAEPGFLPEITHEELWDRLDFFLSALLPVAEASGVRLALHPDDPPLPRVRQQPRLVYEPKMFQRVLDLKPSPSNSLEFCLGTIAEMNDGNLYDCCAHHVRQRDIAYIHFRNVRGKVPDYVETFVDEGDIDMRRVISILRENDYDGVLIPDHAPQMTCDAPWHAGMAHAMGYMKALIDSTP